MRTRNRAPRGSGLGASSSLLIALLHALAGGRLPGSELVRLAQDLETQTIRVPTGRQDYHAAVCGGVNAMWFGVGEDRVESLLADSAWLEESLLLCFTGLSRPSALTNWRMFRAYVDGRPRARQAMARIGRIARDTRQAVLDADLAALGGLLAEEWEHRRRLAPGVSNSRVDHMVREARAGGALGAKLCGAGGGGCLVAAVPPAYRPGVERALTAAGGVILPFRIARQGLHTMVDEATLVP